jgi:hypothetical protein
MPGARVAGLPLNRAGFAVHPPHFVNNEDNTVQACLKEMFPSLNNTSTLQGVLRLCLASLVVRADHLLETLPASHPMLSTYLFRNSQVLDQLRAALVSTDDSTPWVKPTGIPPHVELYKQLLAMQISSTSCRRSC